MVLTMSTEDLSCSTKSIPEIPQCSALAAWPIQKRSGSCSYSDTLEERTAMTVSEPATIDAGALDPAIAAVPNSDAVFLVWAGDRSAYLAKTSMLRRRLLRILKSSEGIRRSLNLRGVATRVEYWLTGS